MSSSVTLPSTVEWSRTGSRYFAGKSGTAAIAERDINTGQTFLESLHSSLLHKARGLLSLGGVYIQDHTTPLLFRNGLPELRRAVVPKHQNRAV